MVASRFKELLILKLVFSQFADLEGFTAWSSTREPHQVFMLLETIYRAFDEVAQTYRVFKVETVGDCYVAVCGLPDPRPDHAVVMVNFSTQCLSRLLVLVKMLEEVLGPDTGDLSMRFGLHSGPITAGVLRGDRSRFQLFGDTVNKASRMESTGQRGRIHISQETRDLLVQYGKGHWATPRKERVWAKGLGEIQTYWAVKMARSAHSAGDQVVGNFVDFEDDKHKRLINWMVDVLVNLLKQIKVARDAKKISFPDIAKNKKTTGKRMFGKGTKSSNTSIVSDAVSLSSDVFSYN